MAKFSVVNTILIAGIAVLFGVQIAMAEQELEVVPVLCGANKAATLDSGSGLRVVKACLNRIHESPLQTLSFFMSNNATVVYFIARASLDHNGAMAIFKAYKEGEKLSQGKEIVKYSEFIIHLLPYDDGSGLLTGQLATGPAFAIELKRL